MLLRVRKVILFMLVVIIMMSGCGDAAGSEGIRDASGDRSDKHRLIRENHFMIQGVKVRDHKDELVEALGLPDKKQEHGDTTSYIYGNLVFYIKEDRIFYISSTDPEYATATGVRVGDSFSDVYENYDRYELRGIVDRYNGVRVVMYMLIPGKDYTVELEFAYDGDQREPRVRSISMLPTSFEEEWLAASIPIISRDGWRVDDSSSSRTR